MPSIMPRPGISLHTCGRMIFAATGRLYPGIFRSSVTLALTLRRSVAGKICYSLSSHLLTLPELKLLIDAVESSKFITAKKSAELIEKLSRMSSIYQAAELKSNLYVSERVKSFNEQIYYLVDNINTAINHGKQISFRYFHFDQHRKEVPNNGGKRSGQLKAQTPVPLKRFISSVKHKSSPISTQAEALAQERI